MSLRHSKTVSGSPERPFGQADRVLRLGRWFARRGVVASIVAAIGLVALYGVFDYAGSATTEYVVRTNVEGSDKGANHGDAGSVVLQGGEKEMSAPPLAPGKPDAPAASIWSYVDVGASSSSLPNSYYQEVEDKALVQVIQPAPLLDVGDHVAVDIPQLGRKSRAVVERVEHGPGMHTRTATGYTTDVDGARHVFVYTVGPDAAFAYIGTPNGTFELVAEGELGWLMPTTSMERHVDHTKPDYFVVPLDELGGRIP